MATSPVKGSPARFRRSVLVLALVAGPVAVAHAQTGSVSGTVTNTTTGASLTSGAVNFCTAAGSCSGAPTSSGGSYTIALAPGTYYAMTTSFNTAGFVNEIHPNLACAGLCDVSLAAAAGSPVVVTSGGAATLNFALDPGAAIAGVVTDAVTSATVQGVIVSIRTLLGSRNVFVHNATTNASGAYSAAGLPPGTYYAFTSSGSTGYVNEIYNDVQCAGACSATLAGNSGTPITITAGAAPAPVNFALTPGGRISGTISDAQTSSPMSGVPVFAYTRVGQSTTLAGSASTNASGVYTIAGLPTGSYVLLTSTIQAINEIYNDVSCLDACASADAVLMGEAVPVTAGATTSGRDFQLNPGGGFSGTVIAAAGGAPVAGVQVVVYRQIGSGVSFASSGFTDSMGAYSVRGLSSGPYFALIGGTPGLVSEVYNGLPCAPCTSATILSAQAIPVTIGAITPGIDFSLEAAATITGTVRSNATAAPLAGASVGIFRSGVSNSVAFVTTNANGVFTATGLPAGTYYASSSGAYHAGEVYNNVPCPAESCFGLFSSQNGAPIAVAGGATAAGIDFSVDPLAVVPAAPTALNAVVMAGGVLFTWAAPTSGGAPAGYVLEAGGAPGTTAVTLPAAGTSVFVASPPAGTFYVRVRAANATGAGPASSEITLRLGGGGGGLPQAPTNLVAWTTGGRLTMTWSAPASGPLPSGYVVEAGSSGGFSNIAVVPVSTRSFVFDGVPPGFYFLRVRARTAAGDGPASAEAMIVVGLVATPPSPPLSLSHTVSGSMVTFTWQAPAAGSPISYVLEAGSATGLADIAVFDTGNANTAFVVNGVPPGAYFVRLRARNGLGAGLVSNERLVVVP